MRPLSGRAQKARTYAVYVAANRKQANLSSKEEAGSRRLELPRECQILSSHVEAEKLLRRHYNESSIQAYRDLPLGAH
jgi:hypothetical protein